VQLSLWVWVLLAGVYVWCGVCVVGCIYHIWQWVAMTMYVEVGGFGARSATLRLVAVACAAA
jgi:hypothetical protein